MAHQVKSLLTNYGEPRYIEGYIETPLATPAIPLWPALKRSPYLYIKLGSPCSLGYLETRKSHSYPSGRSPDGFRREFSDSIYETFVQVRWDPSCDSLLPAGYSPPPPPAPATSAPPRPPQTAPTPPPPAPTHCELCEAEFTPPPRPSFRGRGQPHPKNHRRIWDPSEERILNLCLECAEQWGYGNPPAHIQCDRDPRETVKLWEDW